MYKRILLTICLLVIFSQTGRCWCFAHKVIAHIATKHLTEETKRGLDYYFDSSIVEYSLWMDRFRQEPSVLKLRKLHMGVCNEDFSCDTTINSEFGNIEAWIVREISLLENYKALPDSVVRTELKFLVHQVGDMHCPAHFYSFDMPEWKSSGEVHSGYRSKYGWFNIKYKGRKMTYHALWDLSLDYLYPDLGENLSLYTERIDKGLTPEKKAEILAGTPFDWGRDRNETCHCIYDWAKPGDELDETFFEEHGWIVNEMVLKAGYRLAHVLNGIFDENYSL